MTLIWSKNWRSCVCQQHPLHGNSSHLLGPLMMLNMKLVAAKLYETNNLFQWNINIHPAQNKQEVQDNFRFKYNILFGFLGPQEFHITFRLIVKQPKKCGYQPTTNNSESQYVFFFQVFVAVKRPWAKVVTCREVSRRVVKKSPNRRDA